MLSLVLQLLEGATRIVAAREREAENRYLRDSLVHERMHAQAMQTRVNELESKLLAAQNTVAAITVGVAEAVQESVRRALRDALRPKPEPSIEGSQE